MENNGCCAPPPRRDDCCCKDGILCALDFFYQDFLLASSSNSCIVSGSLKYYPIAPPVSINGTTVQIPNTIYGIPYISQDIVPVYPYTGNRDDVNYLSTCKINGFEFKVSSDACATTIESKITYSFNKIRYTSPNSCCCKNGLIEYLLKAKDFLLTPPDQNAVYVSVPNKSFTFTQILAINKDTVWGKYVDPSTTPATTTYYVVSLCEIEGILFDKYPYVTNIQP